MARAGTRGSAPCVHRRDLLKASVAASALFVADPRRALASMLRGQVGQAASRASALFPDRRLVHADLHNHSLLSDGTGAPEEAFASMRQVGLDVAALTDHASASIENAECQCLPGIDEDAWSRVQRLADEAQVDGELVALRGFEWSSQTLGHVNVWFSERWIDPLHTTDRAAVGGAQVSSTDRFAVGESGQIARAQLSGAAQMRPFYEWLRASPAVPPFGGGGDGLAGFNHPGGEWGDYEAFAYHAPVRDQLVSIEVFNQGDDYLFSGIDAGRPSPINEALNNGWRVGLIGVSDHHGTTWGQEDQLGRAGLWVTALTRAGVREAMASRRFFASLVNGVRFAATANGVPMGGTLPHRRGRIRFEIDVNRGGAWRGKALSVQILAPGDVLPRILTSESLKVPVQEGKTVPLSADVNADESRWLLVRLSDPTLPADRRATGAYASLGGAVVYSSPFWLNPA